MKKILTMVALLTATLGAGAQTMMIHSGSTTYAIPAAKAGTMTYSENGTKLTVMGKTYAISAIDSITMSNTVYKDSTVLVSYSGANASVIIPGTISAMVSDTVKGANVSIGSTQLAGGEIKYTLSGTSTNGSFKQWGGYKCTVRLNGLTLTNPSGAAISVMNGKRIAVELMDGTTNALVDGTDTLHEACFYVKGHAEFSGAGALSLVGNGGHAYKSKEYTELKSSTGKITVTSAMGDALHVGQYFKMNGGTVTISGGKGDGIDAGATSNKTDEMNGQMIINGGSITITNTTADVKGMKCDSLLTINGGTINITSSGNGSKGISTDGNMTINQTVATVPTNITVAVSGTTYTDPTGATSKCMGIKVDGTLTINAGTITVTNTGASSKGIKAGTYKKNGGTVIANVA